MPCWPVSQRDGVFVVTDSDGIVYPITMGRLPVKVLSPGWVPTGLQTGLKPFHLLELRNEDGPVKDAVWYLADDLEFATNHPDGFTPEQADQVRQNLTPLLQDLFERTVASINPEKPGTIDALAGINPIFTRELIGFVVATALTPPELVRLDLLEKISLLYGAGETQLSVPLLRQSLDMVAPSQLLQRLPVASPLDAVVLTAEDQFVPQDGVFEQIYRFHDPAGPAVLYLLFHSGMPCLYMPNLNVAFSMAEFPEGVAILSSLLGHYAGAPVTEIAAPAAAGPAEVPSEPMVPDATEMPKPPVPGWMDQPAAAALAPAAATPAPAWWKKLLRIGQS